MRNADGCQYHKIKKIKLFWESKMKNLPTNIMNKCTSYYPPVFVELWWCLLFHLETTEVFPPNASWPVFQVLWSVIKWKVNKFVRLIYKNWLKLPCDFTKYLRFLHKPYKGSLMYLQCTTLLNYQAEDNSQDLQKSFTPTSTNNCYTSTLKTIASEKRQRLRMYEPSFVHFQ